MMFPIGYFSKMLFKPLIATILLVSILELGIMLVVLKPSTYLYLLGWFNYVFASIMIYVICWRYFNGRKYAIQPTK